MNIQKLLKRANMIRVGGNAHRFICRINGKLRTIATDKKDFATDLASLFSNLNVCSLTPKAAMSFALAAMMGFSSLASAANLPTGGAVVGGAGTISTSGNTMNVNTSTNRSAINWTTFDIANGFRVNFNQPGVNSAVLNRVNGGTPSNINGVLYSNGSVYLINPSGIIFGANAFVNVGSLLASTLPITAGSYANFMAGGNHLVFEKTGSGAPADVVNRGSITVRNGGFATLIGGHVENAATGTITAPNGNILLAAGQQVTFDIDPVIGARVTVDKALQNEYGAYTDAVKNAGLLKADGGFIQLQAKLENNVYSRAVNNEGRIEANTLAFDDEGQVELLAYGGNTADIRTTGDIKVNGGSGSARDAGTVKIQADDDISFRGNLQADPGFFGNAGQITIKGKGDVQTTGAVNTAGGDLSVTSTNSFVNLAHNVDTAGGEVKVDAHADATLTNVNAHGGDISAISHTGDVNINGNLRGDEIYLGAWNNIYNTGNILSNNGTLLHSYNGGILSNNFIGANHGAVTLIADSGNLVNSGTIRAHDGSVNLTASNNVENYWVVDAQNGDLNISAGNDVYNGGSAELNATNNIVINAGNDITNNGKIDPALVVLNAADDITNNGLVAGDTVFANAGDNITNNGVIVGDTVLATAGRNITNNNIIWGFNNTVLGAARNITNNGMLVGGNNLIAYAGRDITNMGAAGGDNVLLYGTRNVNNSGLVDGLNLNLIAGNNINISGQVGSSLTQISSLYAGNDINVSSTETGDCCDPNGPTASAAGRIFGDHIEINANNNVNVDGYVGDGRPDSLVNVTAGNNITGRGLFSGNTVNLLSINGNIGSYSNRIRTAANLLSINAANGEAYVNQFGSVNLQNSTVGGILALTVYGPCATPGDSANLTIGGDVHAHTVRLVTNNGNIVSQGLTSGFNVDLVAHGGSIIDGNGDALNLLSTGNSLIWADGTIGSWSDPFDIKVGNGLYFGAGGSENGLSINLKGSVGSLHPLNVPPGAVIFNGQYLFGNGPVREVLQRGIPYMLQDYRNLTNPLFTTAANTSGKLLKPGSFKNVEAEILNKWQQPEPFDLRLIQNEDQGEAYELLMNH